MSQPQQTTVRNRLIRALMPADFALLQPHLELVETKPGQQLIKPSEPIKRLFFPEVGFVFVTTQGAAGEVKTGIIGREGLIGAVPVLLGSDTTPHGHIVQSAGEMLAISAEVLSAATSRSVSLHKLLLRFVQVQYVQTAQTAQVNASHTIKMRLARWLLMWQDRLDEDELHLTHEFLALMMGIRRPSATTAVQALEDHGLIRASRARLSILNRRGLEELAEDGYGLPEAEYARLIEGA